MEADEHAPPTHTRITKLVLKDMRDLIQRGPGSEKERKQRNSYVGGSKDL